MLRTRLFIFVFLSPLAGAQNGFAMTCSQIRDKADATYQSQKKKTACVLVAHVLGLSPGSTESIYSCGGKKYKLYQLANNDCKVTNEK